MDPKTPKLQSSVPKKKPKPPQWLKGIIFFLGPFRVRLVAAVIVLVNRARRAAIGAEMEKRKQSRLKKRVE